MPLQAWQSLLPLLLLQLHLARRLAETRLLMRYPADARMHIIAYIFGLVYYIVVPLSMLTSGSITRLVTEAYHILADPSARLGLARRLSLNRLVPAVQNEIQRHATLLQTAGVKAAISSAVSVCCSWAVNHGHWLHALAQRAGAWAMAEWEAAPLVVRLVSCRQGSTRSGRRLWNFTRGTCASSSSQPSCPDPGAAVPCWDFCTSVSHASTCVAKVTCCVACRESPAGRGCVPGR